MFAVQKPATRSAEHLLRTQQDSEPGTKAQRAGGVCASGVAGVVGGDWQKSRLEKSVVAVGNAVVLPEQER